MAYEPRGLEVQGAEAVVAGAINDAKGKFLAATGGDLAPFLRENEFAMMILRRNTYAADIARKNPGSLRDALIQSAVTGLSLNPVQGHAYLTPRDGAICFDPSYRGLRDTAVHDGIVNWVRADVVHAADKFTFDELDNGDRIVHHEFDPMASLQARGPIIGGYCAWQDTNGHIDFITENLEELYSSHRSRSTAWTKDNKQSGIWKTDEREAIRKSLIKRAHKSWPRKPGSTGRFDAAVASAIQADDAIDVPADDRIDAVALEALTKRAGKFEKDWCTFFKVASLSELTLEQAKRMNQHLDKQDRDREKVQAAQKPAEVEAPQADPDPEPDTQPEPAQTGEVFDRQIAWSNINTWLARIGGGRVEGEKIGARVRKELGFGNRDLTDEELAKYQDTVQGMLP